MNIGILGSGFMGATHARAFSKIHDARVVAIFSRSKSNADKLAAEVGATKTSDNPMRVIKDPNIDVVSITLPTYLHKRFAIAALEEGKPVLLEKPFALNTRECDQIMNVQARTGTPLMIGHTLRFWPEYAAMQAQVASGRFGKPISATATRMAQAPAWASWFANPKQSGGAILDLVIHDFDAFNWMFGEPRSVFARGRAVQPGLWNHVLATVDFGDAQGIVEGSALMPEGYPFRMSLRVVCEKGVIEYAFTGAGVGVETGASGVYLTAHEAGKSYAIQVESGDAYERQIAYFLDCVRAKRAIEIGSPEQARLAVRVSNAARKSMESGKIFKF